jgi:hypothetical protein
MINTNLKETVEYCILCKEREKKSVGCVSKNIKSGENLLKRPIESSLGRYVFGSEISYNKAPPPLPGLAC